MAPEVAIIDGGGANIASLQFALARCGVSAELTVDPVAIRKARHVILPGVGAARHAMERLRESGLHEVIPHLTQPVLGICLGLQLLFTWSEEEDTECLGIVTGNVRRFTAAPGHPVPHMGWNKITRTRDSALLRGLPDDPYFYFVHSYAADGSEATVGLCDYGTSFSAVVEEKNFLATQFHPERSGPLGAQVLHNFLNNY